jgi:hypothetical protein
VSILRAAFDEQDGACWDNKKIKKLAQQTNLSKSKIYKWCWE